MGSASPTRIRNVTAVLGPTNTGKTHLAIERMLDHETGIIGLPLRLLAREVYDKIVARVGVADVALVTVLDAESVAVEVRRSVEFVVNDASLISDGDRFALKLNDKKLHSAPAV